MAKKGPESVTKAATQAIFRRQSWCKTCRGARPKTAKKLELEPKVLEALFDLELAKPKI